MGETGLHPELEARLAALAIDIATLRRKASHAKGLERIEGLAEVDQLEHRYTRLEEQLRNLNSQGRGFQPRMKAQFKELANDLSGTIENLMMRTDSGFRSNQIPKKNKP